MRLRPLLSLLALPVLLLVLAGCGHQDTSGGSSVPQAEALRVGIIPYENVDKIKDDYGQFADYLGQKCAGKPAKLFVAQEYAGVLQALKSDQIDCAYLNPLSYALAVQEFAHTPQHPVPLAMPYFHNSLTYKGILFARADSGINSVRDFKGKRFAFADLNSTSGYLYPAGMMQQAGIDPRKDVLPANISGTSAVLAVLNKQADGGATYEGGIEKALSNPAEARQLKVVAVTDPIPNGMFVARGDLDPARLAKLKAALVSINTDAPGKAALAKIPWNKVVPPDDGLFNSVREKAKILGLTLQSLAQQDAKSKKP